jgi:hypothetical protein
VFGQGRSGASGSAIGQSAAVSGREVTRGTRRGRRLFQRLEQRVLRCGRMASASSTITTRRRPSNGPTRDRWHRESARS